LQHNEIYDTILKNSVCVEYVDQEKEDLYGVFKAILGTIVILFSSLSVVSLARLLHISKDCTTLHSAIFSSTNRDAVINTSGWTRRKHMRL
jgi:hypothetical protein